MVMEDEDAVDPPDCENPLPRELIEAILDKKRRGKRVDNAEAGSKDV